MNKSKIFLILSLSFIAGIFARSFFVVDQSVPFVLSVLSIIALILFYKNKIILLSGFAILFFVFGIWLVDKKLIEADRADLSGQNFSGEALIVKEPVPKENYQQLTVKLENGEKVMANAGKYPEYFYGDKIKIDCNLQIPENFEDFNYRMYLAKEGIYHACKSAKMELLARDQGSNFYSALLKIKNKFAKNINEQIPFPESGLLSGLLLGGSGGLPENLKNNFSKTGMTHIVAVSGYNVTIIAEYLMLFFIFLGLWRQQAFWAAVIGIGLFVVMIGLPASAVRAGVMGGLLLWAMKNGRLANSQNAIIFSAGVMLLINPLLLRWDIGFQLSFLATLGIVYLYPFFEAKLNRQGKIFFVWEIFFLSLSAQIFVLPIILYNFHNLSLISLLANVLILPIVPLTMLLGFLMALLQSAIPFLGTLLTWLTFLPLKYETAVINFLANFRFSAVEIQSFPWWGVAVWFLILIGVIMQLKRKKIYAP